MNISIVLSGAIGVILLSLCGIETECTSLDKDGSNETPDKKSLQEKINTYSDAIKSTEEKLKSLYNAFGDYKSSNLKQFEEFEDVIDNKEKEFVDFKHVYCTDEEHAFNEEGDEFKKLTTDDDKQFKKDLDDNQEYLSSKQTALTTLNTELAACEDEDCLDKVQESLKPFETFEADLARKVENFDQDIKTASTKIDGSVTEFTKTGDIIRKCLAELGDMKNLVISCISATDKKITETVKQIAVEKAHSESLVNATNTRFVQDIDNQIKIAKAKIEDMKRKADENHLNISECIANESDLEKKRALFVKLFSEIANTFLKSIENETTACLSNLRELQPDSEQVMTQLGKCADLECLKKVNETQNSVLNDVTQIIYADQREIIERTAAFNKSRNDSVESFSNNINSEVVCLTRLQSVKQINDSGETYKKALDSLDNDVKTHSKKLEALGRHIKNIINHIEEVIEDRESSDVKNGIEIVSCPNKIDAGGTHNHMEEFNSKLTGIEDVLVTKTNATLKNIIILYQLTTKTFVEKLYNCLDEDCMNKTVASYLSDEKKNLVKCEEIRNFTSQYTEEIEDDLDNLEDQFSGKISTDYAKVATCLGTAEKIHELSSSFNTSLDKVVKLLDEHSKNLTSFVKATEKLVNNAITDHLTNATKEIESKESVANNKKLDVSSCMQSVSLSDIAKNAMGSFRKNLSQEQETFITYFNESIKNITMLNISTSQYLNKLDLCEDEKCMGDVQKTFETDEKSASDSMRSFGKSVISNTTNLKFRIHNEKVDFLDKTTTAMDTAKKAVLKCLDDKINSGYMFTPSLVTIFLVCIMQMLR